MFNGKIHSISLMRGGYQLTQMDDAWGFFHNYRKTINHVPEGINHPHLYNPHVFLPIKTIIKTIIKTMALQVHERNWCNATREVW
jgi:hypothetical protein